MRAKKTPWFDPYDKAGKCNLKDTGTGVYLIQKESKLLYIGFSGKDVKKTMYRHFQSWDDRKQQRFTYPKTGCRVRIIWVSTEKAAFDLENSLILRLKPKDNLNKLDTYQQRAKDFEKEYLDAETIKPDEPCPF